MIALRDQEPYARWLSGSFQPAPEDEDHYRHFPYPDCNWGDGWDEEEQSSIVTMETLAMFPNERRRRGVVEDIHTLPSSPQRPQDPVELTLEDVLREVSTPSTTDPTDVEELPF